MMDRSAPVWVLTAAALGLLILLPLGWLGYMSVSGEKYFPIASVPTDMTGLTVPRRIESGE